MLESKILCPICKRPCAGAKDKHRHMEEAHSGVTGKDQELMEKTTGKEILHG